MKVKKLTAKQAAFVQEYMIDMNATQACIRAGYSAKTAASIGEENLRKPEVRREIDSLMAERSGRVALSSDDVLLEVRRICLSDIRKVMNRNGTFKMPNELDDDTACAIASVKIKPDGEIEYKFWDKNAAIEKAMKHLGQYERDNQQKTDPLVEFLRGLSGNALPVVKGNGQK